MNTVHLGAPVLWFDTRCIMVHFTELCLYLTTRSRKKKCRNVRCRVRTSFTRCTRLRKEFVVMNILEDRLALPRPLFADCRFHPEKSNAMQIVCHIRMSKVPRYHVSRGSSMHFCPTRGVFWSTLLNLWSYLRHVCRK